MFNSSPLQYTKVDLGDHYMCTLVFLRHCIIVMVKSSLCISLFTSLTSQVSHHPPAAAHHAVSEKGWTLRQEITLASKFRGKYLSIMPLGECVQTK